MQAGAVESEKKAEFRVQCWCSEKRSAEQWLWRGSGNRRCMSFFDRLLLRSSSSSSLAHWPMMVAPYYEHSRAHCP